MKNIWKILLSILLLMTFVYPNDASMASQDGNIFIEINEQIEMAKERVTHKLYEDYAIVRCEFWLVNHGEKISQEIGFPDFYENSASGGCEPIQDFKSIVNGKEVETFQKQMEVKYLQDRDGFEEKRIWYSWILLQ